ncbi:GIY-YIG nuclease family protein [Lactobacillus sp. ESL0791]|uniref:GIY-YIG nuclease family protein n=1 Tax=Lactobacillus sp. ESL0791 TaxID=2983234 RepID=UPI0023F74F23|nr:GIY-YIG nuclease family protein [Lactobacillus sp. ESL0791]MDF7639281.1 GIY-YIG nuclease family protein [Lactobacillus sp. ESL0791]
MTKNLLRSLDDIFNDSDFDKLVLSKPKKEEVTYDPKIEDFIELEDWVAKYNREPEKTKDVSRLNERKLASRLAGIRGDEERIAFLKPYDKQGLLKNNSSQNVRTQIKKEKQTFNSLDEILNDDSVLFSDSRSSGNQKLFDTKKLNEVKRERENEPDRISQRKTMEEFSKFKQLFKQLQADISSGKRQLLPFRNNELVEHGFYVLNGQLLYIESIGDEFEEHNKSNRRTNARLHVIYDNGTENFPLRNGLMASLYGRHGKVITEPDDTFKFTSDDHVTGYVYILESKSNNAVVKQIQANHSLYKVGFTSGSVQKRIANAENESTYLYAPVKIVEEIKIVNLNPESLETAIHHALSEYRLNVEIPAPNGKMIQPREWFVIDLITIEDVVNQIISKLRIAD